jgi:hypothetical protein
MRTGGVITAAAAHPLTEEDRFNLLCDALALCPDCRALLRAYAANAMRSPMQIVRDMLWNFLGDWPHGRGCPT